MTRLHSLMLQALDAASMSVRTLAVEAGYHGVSFARYKTGARSPSPEAALALARVLKRRTKRLSALAERLEAVARASQAKGE